MARRHQTFANLRSGATAALAAAFVSLCATSGWAKPPPVYRMTLLDLPEGYASSLVIDISPRGEVLGQLYRTVPTEGICPFTWRARHGMRLCANVRPSQDLLLGAINKDGVVAGSAPDNRRKFLPFTHARNGDVVRLERLPGASTVVTGINDLGEVVGDNTWYRKRRAAVWRPGMGPVDIQPDGFESSDAHGINVLGQVAVDLRTISRKYAALIEPDGRYTLLPCLDNVPGDCSASAWSINDSSQMVGESQYAFDDRSTHAFIWTAGQGMRSLTAGTNYELGFSSARDINNRGEVVGSVQEPGNGSDAPFLWSAENGIALLADLIDPADPLIDRVKLLSGPGSIFISDRGEIAIRANLDGNFIARTVVLTPQDQPVFLNRQPTRPLSR